MRGKRPPAYSYLSECAIPPSLKANLTKLGTTVIDNDQSVTYPRQTNARSKIPGSSWTQAPARSQPRRRTKIPADLAGHTLLQ